MIPNFFPPSHTRTNLLWLDKINKLCYGKCMPARHRIKQYIENGYYHIYNRGIEKRLIFLDSQDYAVFLSYLKECLLPKNGQELLEKLSNPSTSYREKDKILIHPTGKAERVKAGWRLSPLHSKVQSINGGAITAKAR